MHTHLKSRLTLLVVGVAIAAGFVSAKWLVQGNPLVTLPWGVLALLVAFVAKTKRQALALGGCFGFVASYAYLWFDHTGHLAVSQALALVFLIALPALFGLLCGLLCAWLGWWARKHLFSK